MRHRLIIAGILASGLCGCTSPSVPKIDLSGMALPRFELFRYGVKETRATTTPYKQIVIAMGQGATAGLSAFDHLIRTSAPAAPAAELQDA